jgi:hypothetical protein
MQVHGGSDRFGPLYSGSRGQPAYRVTRGRVADSRVGGAVYAARSRVEVVSGDGAAALRVR